LLRREGPRTVAGMTTSLLATFTVPSFRIVEMELAPGLAAAIVDHDGEAVLGIQALTDDEASTAKHRHLARIVSWLGGQVARFSYEVAGPESTLADHPHYVWGWAYTSPLDEEP
jgi:hypothetical protein